MFSIREKKPESQLVNCSSSRISARLLPKQHLSANFEIGVPQHPLFNRIKHYFRSTISNPAYYLQSWRNLQARIVSANELPMLTVG